MADDKLKKGNPSAPAPEHGIPEQFGEYEKRHDNAKPKRKPGEWSWSDPWNEFTDILSGKKSSISEQNNLQVYGEDVGIFPFLSFSPAEKKPAKEEIILDDDIIEEPIIKVPDKPKILPKKEYDAGMLDEIVVTAKAPSSMKLSDETPFDPRIFRNIVYTNTNTVNREGAFDERQSPYSNSTAQTRIKEFTPYITSKDKAVTKAAKEKRVKELVDGLIGDGNSWGVQSLMNPYAQVSLYNGLAVVRDGGNYKVDKVSLLDKRDRKKFYDINSNNPKDVTSIHTPTTTNIIQFGNMDPFGRTPYSYQDFVFCKYWNKIPNNRMLTLRRFPLPTLDNLNFPGMTEGNNLFSPISTAITYFGGETDNKLSSLLSFTVGFNWEDLEGSVHDVDGSSGEGTGINNLTELIGDNGPVNLYTSMLKTLSFFGDESNTNTMNREAIIGVPDPYENGPYENKLKGPVNVINKVKQRQTGLEFKNSLSLTFNYVARPIGGINTKAAMLDILANMLVMGYANGLFWGGSYRFMTNPNLYPLKGFNDVAKKLYAGDFEGAAADMIYNVKDSFQGMANVMNMFLDTDIFGAVRNAFTALLNGDMGEAWSSIGEAVPNDNLKNNIKGYFSAKLAKKTGIENITGMRALLTGDPVGDWHLTIGNPLNPIAVIGNLIVKSMKVEFGDELGPDDFPMEMKITIELEHGMGRDKSSIESMFNRGNGRIYTLPDHLSKTSADGETKVDKYTGAGTKPAGEYTATEINALGMYGRFANRHKGSIKHETSRVVNADSTILQIPKYTPVDVDNLYTEFESKENSNLGRHHDYSSASWLGEKTIN